MLLLGGKPFLVGGAPAYRGVGDAVAPTLTAPVDAANGSTAATGSVDTDEANGTLYWVATTSATSPSRSQVRDGFDHTGAAAADSDSQSVSGTGTQTLSPAPSGLTASTTYYLHFMHEDAAGNQSDVATADGFTTAASGAFAGMQPATTSLTHRGVTINLSTATPYFWSANGDPVFVTADNATTITSFSPAGAVDAGGRPYNGAEANPWGVDDQLQGFDKGMEDQDGNSPSGVFTYSAAKNIDPNAAGNSAYSISQGSSVSVVKSVRSASWTLGNWKPVEKYVVFTFMGAEPTGAGTPFRPSFSATTKAYPTKRVDDMVFSGASSPLRELTRPTNVDLPSVSLADLEAKFVQTPLICVKTGEYGRRAALREEGADSGYSVTHGNDRALYMLSLHTSQTGSELTAKTTLAKYMIQWGIDVDGSVQRGSTYAAGAGQHNGFLPYIFLSAFMLDDSAMLARAQTVLSNCISQPYWVTAREVGFPTFFDSGNDGGGQRTIGETYQTVDLGAPDWQKEPGNAVKCSGHIFAVYRETWMDVCLHELLAVCLLRNGPSATTGDVALRNGANSTSNPRAAAVAYMDDTATWLNETGASNTFNHASDTRANYDAWRSHFASTTPIWALRPRVPQGANHGEFSAGGTAGTVNFSVTSISPRDHSTQTITDRQIRVSQDLATAPDADGIQAPYQYVDETELAGLNLSGASSGTITGLRHGTDHYLSWRQQNASGWSRWSQNWQLRHPNSTVSADKVPRRKVTTSGTASGTLTNVVAPKVLYKPYPGHPMPEFEPAPTPATGITEFYAGIGYWTGGTGALSATYQWQRDTGGGFANISGATSKTYARTTTDSGNSIRCVVTVNGSAVNSNSIAIPAASSIPSTTIIESDLDGEFPFNYPTVWTNINSGVTGFEVNHLPNSQMEPELTAGAIWFRKTTSSPVLSADLTTSAPLATYNVIIHACGGYFPSNPADTDQDNPITVRVADSANAQRGDCNWTIAAGEWNNGPVEYIWTGSFTVSGGDTTVRLRITASGAGQAAGMFGGPVITKVSIKQ